MGGTTVTAADGTEWTVRRRWIPHRDGVGLRARFRRRPGSRTLDALDLPVDVDGVVAVVVAIAAILFVIFLGWPLLLLLIDLIWLALALAIGLAAKVLFRRPWHVDATSGDGEHRIWKVVGFRAAGDRVREVADHLAAGITLPYDEWVPPATINGGD